MGSVAGVLAAAWSLRAFITVLPFDLPSSAPPRLDPPVLLFSVGVAMATAILFSLAPLLASSRVHVYETLKSAGRSSGGARQRTRSVLVAAEVALSVTLLVAAALLVQSLYRLHHEPLGFRSAGILTFWTPLAPQRYRTGIEQWNFENAMMQRLGALPGVRSVGAVNALPLTNQNNYPVEPDGRPDANIVGMEIRVVTPSYFDTMGISLVRGRGFSDGDAPGTQPVILVNETVARRWWPDGSAIGRGVLVAHLHGKDLSDGYEKARTIVGIVADTKTVDLRARPRPTVYLPAGQTVWYAEGMAWVVRAERPAGIAEQVRRAVMEIEPRQRVERIRTMEDVVAATTTASRFDAWLYGIFAALALLLTTIGVYGLLAFAVARRTNEIGTRMALGATRSDVLRMVLRQGLGLVAAGLVVGMAGALLLTRSLATLLFGVRATDPVSFAAVAVLLVTVGTLASYLPARRATKVDPMVALRYE